MRSAALLIATSALAAVSASGYSYSLAPIPTDVQQYFNFETSIAADAYYSLPTFTETELGTNNKVQVAGEVNLNFDFELFRFHKRNYEITWYPFQLTPIGMNFGFNDWNFDFKGYLNFFTELIISSFQLSVTTNTKICTGSFVDAITQMSASPLEFWNYCAYNSDFESEWDHSIVQWNPFQDWATTQGYDWVGTRNLWSTTW
jgi:hypothetical protein